MSRVPELKWLTFDCIKHPFVSREGRNLQLTHMPYCPQVLFPMISEETAWKLEATV